MLDPSVRFGATTVTCEGFAYRDDPYVLKGSCGLEYTLNRNYVHAETWGALIRDWLFPILAVILAILAAFFIYKALTQQRPDSRSTSDGSRPTGGSGRPGPRKGCREIDIDDPPPYYSQFPRVPGYLWAVPGFVAGWLSNGWRQRQRQTRSVWEEQVPLRGRQGYREERPNTGYSWSQVPSVSRPSEGFAGTRRRGSPTSNTTSASTTAGTRNR